MEREAAEMSPELEETAHVGGGWRVLARLPDHFACDGWDERIAIGRSSIFIFANDSVALGNARIFTLAPFDIDVMRWNDE